MRQQNFFVIFCLILTLGLIEAHSVFKDFFSDSKDLQKQIVQWKEAKEREALRVVMLQNQMKDFQMEVAQAVPGETFLQKNILSQVRIPASESAVDLSSSLLERGRQFFRDKDYVSAIKSFQDLIVKFPTSGRAIEARFLMAESYFLSAKFPQCIDQVDEMMTQYPENELTGFIMLRMGQILDAKNQNEQAAEVYRTVQKRFPSSEALKNQTAILLKNSGKL